MVIGWLIIEGWGMGKCIMNIFGIYLIFNKNLGAEYEWILENIRIK